MPRAKMKERVVRLVVDAAGDVVFAQFDHHQGTNALEIQVPWDGMKPTPGPLKIIVLSYRFRESALR